MMTGRAEGSRVEKDGRVSVAHPLRSEFEISGSDRLFEQWSRSLIQSFFLVGRWEGWCAEQRATWGNLSSVRVLAKISRSPGGGFFSGSSGFQWALWLYSGFFTVGAYPAAAAIKKKPSHAIAPQRHYSVAPHIRCTRLPHSAFQSLGVVNKKVVKSTCAPIREHHSNSFTRSKNPHT